MFIELKRNLLSHSVRRSGTPLARFASRSLPLLRTESARAWELERYKHLTPNGVKNRGSVCVR